MCLSPALPVISFQTQKPYKSFTYLNPKPFNILHYYSRNDQQTTVLHICQALCSLLYVLPNLYNSAIISPILTDEEIQVK